jgi:phosphohistidine phosphatase
MDCILFRHGIAVEPEQWDGEEAKRPLTKKGLRRLREAVAGLAALNAVPTHIVSSSYVRARETAELLRDTLAPETDIKEYSELHPDGKPEKVLALLATFPADACVLCVGHEPNLGAVAGVMLCVKPVATLSLKKAGACLVRFEGAPKPGQGELRWWMMPSQVRAFRKT